MFLCSTVQLGHVVLMLLYGHCCSPVFKTGNNSPLERYKRRPECSHENRMIDPRLSEPNDYKIYVRLDGPSFNELFMMALEMLLKP